MCGESRETKRVGCCLLAIIRVQSRNPSFLRIPYSVCARAAAAARAFAGLPSAFSELTCPAGLRVRPSVRRPPPPVFKSFHLWRTRKRLKKIHSIPTDPWQRIKLGEGNGNWISSPSERERCSVSVSGALVMTTRSDRGGGCCCCGHISEVVKMPNARNVANRCVNFVTIGEFINTRTG